MSKRPPKEYSPSKPPNPISAHTPAEANKASISFAAHQDLTETPKSTAEQPFSTPGIVIAESITSSTPTPDSSARQSRSFAIRHRPASGSTSQPPRTKRSSTPYERPQRFQSQPLAATIITSNTTMSSSGSSPPGTSTAGSSSGSSQLPYAPFPYPMPANPRGGSGQQGGQGK